MKLSIVIPAHNEEHRLPETLKAYVDYFEQHLGCDVEFIVPTIQNRSLNRQLTRNLKSKWSLSLLRSAKAVLLNWACEWQSES